MFLVAMEASPQNPAKLLFLLGLGARPCYLEELQARPKLQEIVFAVGATGAATTLSAKRWVIRF